MTQRYNDIATITIYNSQYDFMTRHIGEITQRYSDIATITICNDNDNDS
jgi:hypothetical protein